MVFWLGEHVYNDENKPMNLFFINSSLLSTRALLKHFVVQKIFRINGNVPWPVHHSSEIFDVKKIDPGSRCPGLSRNCFIDGRNGILFGKNVWVGPRVSIISQDHDNYDLSKYTADSPIIIGNNCLLAANCVILPGVELGNNTIVGAGAIVTKSFCEGNQVIAGNPARVVKRLRSCVE